MTDRTPSDETLMAYADGLLDRRGMREVEAALQRDPTIAQRIEAFRETGRRLRALGRAQEDIPSDALIGRIRALAAGAQDAQATGGPPVVDLAARRPAPESGGLRRRVPLWQVPLAASIFLAIGLWGGDLAGPEGSDEPDAAQMALLDSEPVHEALRQTPAGQRRTLSGGGDMTLISSFSNADGQLCREFEIGWPDRPTVVSVSCHVPGLEPDGWSTQLAVLAAPAEDQGYAPASSLETLDAYLGAIGAGPPLSDEDEAEALANLE